MVDVHRKRCAYEECSKRPQYGREGNRTAEFCWEHKMAGMVDIFHKRCGYEGCSKQPSFGVKGIRKADFCGKHKRAGMVDVSRRPCAYGECSRRPTFGVVGSRKAQFCVEHKRADMVDVCNKQCAYEGCSRRPTYGREGSRKAEFCQEHKIAKMAAVFTKRCAHETCSRTPSFGMEGSRKVVFCGEHKKAGMVNVSNKRCAYEGCSRRPSYGREGSRKTEFCREHKIAGMVNVVLPRCTGEGCAKNAWYGLENSKRGNSLCARHYTEHRQGELAQRTPASTSTTRPSALKAAREEGGGGWVEEEKGEQLERVVMFDRLPLQVQKESGDSNGGPPTGKRRRVAERDKRDPSQEAPQVPTLVREPSPITSPTDVMPSATQDRNCKSPANENLGRDERAISQAHKRWTGPACGMYGSRDLPSSSTVAPPSSQRRCIQVVARPKPRHRKSAASTEVGSGHGAVREGGGCGGVIMGDEDRSTALRDTGYERDISTIASIDRHGISAPSAFTREEQLKMVSLEGDNRDMVAEAGERAAADAVAPGVEISASLPQSVMAELATIASPTTFATVFAAAKPCARAPTSQPPTPEISALDKEIKNAGLREITGLGELEAEEEAVAPLGCLDLLTVAIKPER